MAKRKEKDKSERHIISNAINKLATNTQKLLNLSYMNNYYNTTDNSRDLDNIHTGINNAINNIIQTNKSNHGMSSLSVLYNNIINDEKDINNGLKKIFENDSSIENLLNIYILKINILKIRMMKLIQYVCICLNLKKH